MKNEFEAIVEAQMLIRKPVDEVFTAFIDPEITSKFWFTKSSGKLELNKNIIWEWEMYDVTIPIFPLEISKNQLIKFKWGDPKTTVEFHFTKTLENDTYVEIKNYGFNMPFPDILKAIGDLTGGFTTVLDGLKAYLEHGILLNLIGDKFLKSQ